MKMKNDVLPLAGKLQALPFPNQTLTLGGVFKSRLFLLLFPLLALVVGTSIRLAAQAPVPEVLFYKFDSTGTGVRNLASSPPAGTAFATIMGNLVQGDTGRCDGALVGSGNASSTDFLNTGWAPNLGTGSWTISFWTKDFGINTTLYYIFGDANTNSFRCFTNGVAGANNWILRGAGLTDIYINGGATVAPHVCTFVYDAVANNVKGYLDSVLVTTVAQGAVNITGAGPFKVMGYGSNIGAPAGGLLDEFRVYSRALSAAEVTALVTASCTTSISCYQDSDTDTYGDIGVSQVFEGVCGAGFVQDSSDCDDANSAIHPGADEICTNGIDENCDDFADQDCDNDGYRIAEGDCDDSNPAINPGVAEVCSNGIDDNCDTMTDTGDDLDQDGYTIAQGDCDDCNGNVGPSASEICNSIDDNCDLLIDNFGTGVKFLEDFDGIPGETAGGAGTYAFPTGWFLRNVDNRTPAGAVAYVNEAWERREDFNFNVTDSAAFNTSWYTPAGPADDWMWTPLIGPISSVDTLTWNAVTYDPDYRDGYEVRVMTAASGPPTGGTGAIGNQVSNSTQIFSIAQENTSWTPRSVSLAAFAGQSVYIGFRNNSNDKFLLLIDDVKVEGPASPPEVCNDLDDDCNGLVDDGLPVATYYADADNDTYGDLANPVVDCSQPAGYVTDSTDCNDNNAAIHPGATEDLCNGLDDDCNGAADDVPVIPGAGCELVYGASPFQDSLWVIDTANNFTVVGRFGPTPSSGGDITGINGLARHPLTGVIYGIIKQSGVSGRVLATYDPVTAVFTVIGNLGDNFSSITFSPSGQLFGVTGDGASVPETLYDINPTNASKTLLTALGNGVDGEVICYNPDDNFIYHWSGNGTIVFEKIQSVAPYTVTNIPISGSTSGETFGAAYVGGGKFLISNISSSFNYVLTTGQWFSAFGSNPDDLRGLVFGDCGSACYQDLDGDGFGDPAVSQNASVGSCPAGFVPNNLDCNDEEEGVNVCASETCNGLDDDCNGLVDDGLPDVDNDGYSICDDCDDNNGDVNPGAVEVCNAIDDDCNGTPDDVSGGETLIGSINFTGSEQIFIVPANVTSLVIEAIGAQGGNGGGPNGGTGGFGGLVKGTLSVTPGDTIYVNAGGQGGLVTGGWNGGANGGVTAGGGGGGATDVRYGGNTLADRIIIAGGGGGGGGQGCESGIISGGAGGGGNGNAGADGTDAPTFGGGVAGAGKGGMVGTGGAGGAGCGGFLGQPGNANGVGGNGQACCCFGGNHIPSGGGGGGGLNVGGGGGGGSAGTTSCSGNDKGAGGGGAGGTNFIHGSLTNQLSENGTEAGNGVVNFYVLIAAECDVDEDGYTLVEGDCDDNNGDINPGAAEICNGIDEDCDGTADDGLTFLDYYLDSDSDTYGAGAAINACESPGAGYVLQGGDCNDNNTAINPGATEICNGGTDDDCDGLVDSADPSVLDTIPPTVVCQSYTVNLSSAGTATIAPANVLLSSSDNCDPTGDYLNLSVIPNSFNCNNIGANTVMLTVTDMKGNSDTCSATVTVQDLVLPNAICQNLTVFLDAAGQGSLTAAQVNNGSNDACGIQSLSISDTAFTCSDLGANTVTLTVTDVNANVNNCNANVSVVDNLPPVVACTNINITLGSNGYAGITSPMLFNPAGSSDNCGTVNPQSLSQNLFDCGDIGNNTVTLTGNDGHGNTATCQATVTVAPFITNIEISVTPSNCGGSDGIIQVSASALGGQLRYSINNFVSFNLTGIFNNLSPGMYPISVMAAGTSGCTASGGVVVVPAVGTPVVWYKDFDGDDYSDGNTQTACLQPAGYQLPGELTATTGDCNDNNPLEFPGQTWYRDADNDGYSSGQILVQCSKPSGYKAASQLTQTSGDCNDTNGNIRPGATEICNSVDDDCDSQVDEGVASGQTYVGNVTFNSQAQVNAWAACYSVIQGNLTVQNANVTSLSALANIVKVTGHVTIKLSSLVNMNGLHNLDTIGGNLTINNNNSGSKLQSLDGLEDVDWVGGNLKVFYNFTLTDCCAIEDLVGPEPNGTGGTVSVYSNASGCNTVTQIVACAEFGGNGNSSILLPDQPCPDCPSTAMGENWQVMAFPNPASEMLNVEIEGDFKQGIVGLTDLAGRWLLQREVMEGESNLVLPLDALQNGLYFLQVRSGEGQVKMLRIVVAK